MKNNRPAGPSRTTNFLVVHVACLWLVAAAVSGAQPQEETPQDLLRFLNGDSLHGEFLGMKNSELSWRHRDAREPIMLKTIKLRRVAFNGGRAPKMLRGRSYVLLQDGDRIPGTIEALDSERLTIATEFAGTISVPRGALRQIAPNPQGGELHYLGPFSADDWTVIAPPGEEKKEAAEPAKIPDEEDAEDQVEIEPGKKAGAGAEAEEEEEEEEEEELPWVFGGGAYYSNGLLPIAVDTKAPDKARMGFTMAWRNRLNVAIAFHATMEVPPKPAAEEKEEAEKDGDDERAANRRLALRDSSNSGYALTYGHSYVLTIYSNYAQLYHCGFNDEGEPVTDRLTSASSNLHLEETGEAEFELRCDREESSITLFVNGRYITQWKDELGYAGTGSHLAFACQSSSSRLRISDVVVSSWNGMIDSAQSMETDDRDVVLLSNGTDRFSGEVLSLDNGKFRIRGTYAELTIPQEDVQEIRTARSRRTAEDPEAGSRESVRLLFQPLGRITLQPLEAFPGTLKGHHPALGDLTLDLGYSGLMEFSFGHSVLDSWDDDY